MNNDSSMFLMLDLVSLGCGLYCLYTWIRLIVEKRLFKNGLLIPKDKTAEDCLDEAGFIAYMKPRLAVLSIVTMLYGVLQLLNDSVLQTPLLNLWQTLALLGVVLAVLVWYAIASSKANREYFGM